MNTLRSWTFLFDRVVPMVALLVMTWTLIVACQAKAQVNSVESKLTSISVSGPGSGWEVSNNSNAGGGPLIDQQNGDRNAVGG